MLEWLKANVGWAAAILGLASLVVCWAIYTFLAFMISANKKIESIVQSTIHGRGLKRSIALLMATLAFDGFATWLEIPALLSDPYHPWVVFFRILAVGWVAAVVTQTVMWESTERGFFGGEKSQKLVIPVLARFATVSILAVALVSALAVLGANVWGMLAGIGIGGVAIAFAAKDSVENIFGSVTVVLDMPFGVGDWVKIGTVEGVVEAINLRSTRIRTFEDSLVTFPNSNFIKASVENLGQRRTRRIKTTVPVGGNGDFEAFSQTWQQAVASMEKVQPDSAIVSMFEIKETGAVYQIVARAEAETYADEMRLREAVLVAGIRAAEAHELHVRIPKE